MSRWSGLPLGPAAARGGGTDLALSSQRVAVLEQVQQRSEPVTVTSLAVELHVHPNTVREHLDALVGRGLVRRERAPAQGRGRPAWLYSASDDHVEPDLRVRDYAGLAQALAAHIQRTSTDPVADGLAAGRVWGRELAAGPADVPPLAGSRAGPVAGYRGGTAARSRAVRARHQVIELLTRLGFAPDTDARATTAALRRCPLLDAARRHPDVVCSVHLGIVRGAMAEMGGDPARTDLVAFAEPGACRLSLLTRA